MSFHEQNSLPWFQRTTGPRGPPGPVISAPASVWERGPVLKSPTWRHGHVRKMQPTLSSKDHLVFVSHKWILLVNAWILSSSKYVMGRLVTLSWAKLMGPNLLQLMGCGVRGVPGVPAMSQPVTFPGFTSEVVRVTILHPRLEWEIVSGFQCNPFHAAIHAMVRNQFIIIYLPNHLRDRGSSPITWLTHVAKEG